MTAYVINSGGVTNYDALTTPSVNATLDTYAISVGSTLVVRTDSYACPNHSTAAGSLDTVTFSGIGGELKFDPTYVRYVAYTAGGGTVPAYGTAISQGGVSGVFLGVWASWITEPVAPAGAVPATGFIKIGGVTGGAFAAGALTGITATCSGADLQSWIEIRGADTATITVPRIGKVTSVEAWFELGTTNGTAGQILPCPTTASFVGTFAGVWIETSAGSGVYERFSGAGSQVALATTPTDERAKIVWSTVTGIRIGNNGTNNVGFLPPTGCKVRIPATILTNVTRTAGGSGARVLPNATIATRQEFITTGAGYFDLRGIVSQWYMNFVQPFYVKYKSCAINDSMVISECASPLDVDDCIVSPTQAQLNLALNLSSNFAGGTIQNSRFTRFSLAASGAYTAQINYCTGVTFDACWFDTLTLRANGTTGNLTSTQPVNCTFTNCTGVGGRFLFVGAQNCTFNDLRYSDSHIATTATNPFYALEFTTGSNNTTVIGGRTLGAIANTHPYNGFVSYANSYNLRVQEVATYASPFNCGSANAMGVGVNLGGNNDGVELKKCYFSNTRTGLWASTNSDTNVTIENFAGDYADTTVNASLNTVIKGVGMTSATTGQISVYGTHWRDRFVSTTAGAIEILCNEPTVASASQCSIVAGTPQFNSSGSALLTVLGQEIEWVMPYFALGHTALANLAPTLTGTNTGNLTYTFQYDLGSGWNGSWLTLNATNLNGVGAINPATGVKLKVRAVCSVANAGNIITNIRITTVTTSADQSTNLYPLDPIPATFSFSGLEVGTEVVLFNSSNVELKREVIAGTVFEYDYTWVLADVTGCYALIWKDDKVAIKFTGISLTNTSVNVPIAQADDLVYNGTYTPSATINFGSKLQILGVGSLFSIPQMYSEWKDEILLTSNAQYDFAYEPVGGQNVGGVKSIPKYVFQVNSWKIRPAEANAQIALADGIIVPQSGSPFVNTVGSFIVNIEYDAPVQAIAVNTGGAVSPTQQQIRDAMTLAAIATPVSGSIDSKLTNVSLIPALL
jgi:hypothetical protein